MSFPRGPEDLTTAWLSEALGTSVDGFEVEQIGVGVGVLGRLFRVTLDAGASAPPTIVAKFPTADEGTRLNVAAPLRVYQREAQFYRDLAASIPIGTPTVYAAEFDEASGDFVLLIEDLSSMRCADQIAGCSVADAETVLDHIADHHVHFAGPGGLAQAPWVPGIDDPVMQAVVGGMAEQALPGFFEVFGDGLDSELVRFFESMPEMLPRFMQAADEGEGTITFAHVDLRLDNVFFGGPERPMVLIDWQLGAQGPFAYDVAYFLSQSMDTELRRAHEAALVDRYLERVNRGGITLDRDGFDLDYRRTVAFCAVYPVNVAGNIELANERAVALARSMYDRAMAAVADHDALAVWFD